MNSTLAPFPFHVLHDAVSRGETLWLLLDGANPANPLHTFHELDFEQYIPLFCRTHYAHLMSVSPLLVEVSLDSPVLSWFLNGHAHDIGFLFGAKTPPELLVKNLRRCLDVRMPDGGTGLLRFCDPQIFADLLRLECPGVMRLLTRDMSFFAVCATDLENINMWMYGLRISQHDVPGDAVCSLSVEDVDVFEAINEKRMILRHILSLPRYESCQCSEVNEYTAYESLNGFELTPYTATHAFHINSRLYYNVHDRLLSYENKFDILCLDDLFTVDSIIESCNDGIKKYVKK